MQRISDEDFARLAANIPDAEPRKSRAPRWRKGARHWRDEQTTVKIDRNERVRLIARAEALESRTKTKGRHGGLLGRPALHVLRVMLYQFANVRSGLCCPSYRKLAEATGYCIQTIATALKRLERAGLIRISRRLETKHISRECPHTGVWQSFLQTVQGVNHYRFDRGYEGLEMLLPAPIERSFPEASPAGLLQRMYPSLARREKHTP